VTERGIKTPQTRRRGMSRCCNIRESIKAVYDEAKAQGVPQKELRTLVEIRKHEKASTKLYHELEHDQQENLKMLAATVKVMDLPLWRATQHAKPMFN
jgi:uncharacterized protein (UPF0335 family)